MGNDRKAATETLLCALFVEMLELARTQGITVKRMRELLPVVQLRALEEAGLNQVEIMAESGYTRKWIRKVLDDPLPDDCTNPLDKFVSGWAADSEFPDTISINGEHPSFYHLHDKHGGDFTAPSLLKILKERGIIEVEGDYVTLDAGREVTATSGPDMIKAAQCSLSALFETLKHNLSGVGEPYTERRLWSHRVPEEQVAILREKIREANTKHYQRILDLLAQHQAPPAADDAKCVPAVGVGLYWYEKRNT